MASAGEISKLIDMHPKQSSYILFSEVDPPCAFHVLLGHHDFDARSIDCPGPYHCRVVTFEANVLFEDHSALRTDRLRILSPVGHASIDRAQVGIGK